VRLKVSDVGLTPLMLFPKAYLSVPNAPLMPSAEVAVRETSAMRTESMTCWPPETSRKLSVLRAVGLCELGDLAGDFQRGDVAFEDDVGVVGRDIDLDAREEGA